MLFHLPLELCDLIIEKVDSPADLAALSAVCKTLKKWISPAPADELGPLQCCYLSVTLDNADVFEALVARPRLARCVKRLRLVGAQQDRPPGIAGMPHRRKDSFWNAHTVEISKYDPALVNSAMRAMENLQFLTTRAVVTAPYESLFFGLRQSCPYLRDMSLGLNLEEPRCFGTAEQQPGEHCLSKYFSGLEGGTCYRLSFGICSTVPGDSVISSFSRSMRNLLFRSRLQVRYLSIKQDPTSLQPLFQLLFPSLEYFELLTAPYVSFVNPVELSFFLENHPTLQHVVLHAEVAPLPDESLPNLRRMYCTAGSQITTILKPLADGTYRPLEWLYINRTLVENGRTALLKNIPTLTTLDMYEPQSGITVFEMPVLPHVTTLSWCPFSLIMEGDSLGETERIIDFLSLHFPHLTSLKSFLNYMTDWPYPIPTLLSELGSACPHLTIVDDWVRRSSGEWENDESLSKGLRWMFELEADHPIECFGMRDSVTRDEGIRVNGNVKGNGYANGNGHKSLTGSG